MYSTFSELYLSFLVIFWYRNRQTKCGSKVFYIQHQRPYKRHQRAKQKFLKIVICILLNISTNIRLFVTKFIIRVALIIIFTASVKEKARSDWLSRLWLWTWHTYDFYNYYYSICIWVALVYSCKCVLVK